MLDYDLQRYSEIPFGAEYSISYSGIITGLVCFLSLLIYLDVIDKKFGLFIPLRGRRAGHSEQKRFGNFGNAVFKGTARPRP